MMPFLAGEQGNNDFLCPDMYMCSNEIMFFCLFCCCLLFITAIMNKDKFSS